MQRRLLEKRVKATLEPSMGIVLGKEITAIADMVDAASAAATEKEKERAAKIADLAYQRLFNWCLDCACYDRIADVADAIRGDEQEGAPQGEK